MNIRSIVNVITADSRLRPSGSERLLAESLVLMRDYKILDHWYNQLRRDRAKGLVGSGLYRDTFGKLIVRFRELLEQYALSIDNFINGSCNIRSGAGDTRYYETVTDRYLFLQKRYRAMQRQYEESLMPGS
jgi:hypothetical protein